MTSNICNLPSAFEIKIAVRIASVRTVRSVQAGMPDCVIQAGILKSL